MKKKLTLIQREKLLGALKERFGKNMNRHKGMKWEDILVRLEADEKKLCSLWEMEATGGEPDVVGCDQERVLFYDCSPESPSGRRSLCYDEAALALRKDPKPENSALEMAAAMGIELLTEARYRTLQKLGEFDKKTSSWIKTPDEIRGLGGALFCDRRYDTVFVYHNGAGSYYSSRGFRGWISV